MKKLLYILLLCFCFSATAQDNIVLYTDFSNGCAEGWFLGSPSQSYNSWVVGSYWECSGDGGASYCSEWYWSSTQINYSEAAAFNFLNGSVHSDSKHYNNRVRLFAHSNY